MIIDHPDTPIHYVLKAKIFALQKSILKINRLTTVSLFEYGSFLRHP